MSLCENSSNVNLAAGLIAASWQSSQRQSVVDGVECREKLLKEEKKSVLKKERKRGMKCNPASALIVL